MIWRPGEMFKFVVKPPEMRPNASLVLCGEYYFFWGEVAAIWESFEEDSNDVMIELIGKRIVFMRRGDIADLIFAEWCHAA